MSKFVKIVLCSWVLFTFSTCSNETTILTDKTIPKDAISSRDLHNLDASDSMIKNDVNVIADMKKSRDLATDDASMTDSSVGSFVLDPNPLESFHNDYRPYNTKAELNPQTTNSGKTVYIVNQGGGDTSVPSCLNGKVVLQDCPPTGWKFGVKANEIYALRLKTKANYVTAGIRARMNTFSGGQTLQANYKYAISDKAGTMTNTTFEGHCIFEDVNSSSTVYVDAKEVGSNRCRVPEDRVFYLNIELVEAHHAKCDTGICSGYLLLNGLDIPNFFKN